MEWLDRFSHHSNSKDSKKRYAGIPNFTRDGPDPATVSAALLELFSTGAEGTRQLLERQREILLTDNAIAAVVQMAREKRHTDPTSASMLLMSAELLDRARCISIEAALSTLLADRRLVDLQMELLGREPHAQRSFLEEHLELLSYGSLGQILRIIVYVQQEAVTAFTFLQLRDLNGLWYLLFDARRRGGDVSAIRDACINFSRGFTLDVPDWLASTIEQVKVLRNQGRPDRTARMRIALWEEAIQRIQREPGDIAPEILAEMYARTQLACNDALGVDKAQLQQKELTNLLSALKIYTEKRYPYAWASIQGPLGALYLNYLQGDRSENIEKAIACLQAVLRIFTEQDFPLEWAQTQNYLGWAYRERLQGNKEENQEQALLFFQAALRVLSEQNAPVDWAMVQNNLGTLYIERLHERNSSNIHTAIACLQAALRIFTEQDFPLEWAKAQMELGITWSVYFEGNPTEDRLQAIDCFQAALHVMTEQELPIEWATLQTNLGNLFNMMSKGNSVENQERSIAHYQASLRVFTEQDFPLEWARSLNNLGTVYSKRLHEGDTQENQKQSITCFQMALRVYTRQDFPELHRSISLNVASCAARSELWELAHVAANNAREAEDDLLALAAGVKEMDTILRQGDQGVQFDVIALTRLGRYAEAAVAIERGRARSLAAAHLLNAADPQRIRDPRRRETYIAHRTALLQAQAAVQQVATSRQPTSREWLALTATWHEVKATFDATVAAIRAADDPADFLHDDFSAETLLSIQAEKPTGHALIYVLATPCGGLALGVFGSNPVEGTHARFVALDLPALTVNAVANLVATAFPDDTKRVLGGYALAQGGKGLGIMTQRWGGTSFADCAARLHTFCLERQLTSTLDTAAQEIKRKPSLRDIINIPWQELSRKQEQALNSIFNYYFLRHELRQSLEWLAEAALRPMAAWLQKQNITSMTLIPCGLLAAFPLLAAPLEVRDDALVTLADCWAASVAPSVRSLQQSPRTYQQRSGVAAVGNPYPTHQSLLWGEAEALTLAHLGGIPTRAAIQKDADRAHLLEMLRTAKVVDVACHGIAEDEYLQSRLGLANGENLTLADALNGAITNMHGLRLLILSACQTAIPDLFGAPDEVRSLAVGMLQAGAEAVLATLWSIDDTATYLLVVRFAQEWFPHMETEPPAAALARAQRWLRTVTNRELQGWQATKPLLANWQSPHHSVQKAEENLQEQAGDREPQTCPYADPFYWAGFQLYGW